MENVFKLSFTMFTCFVIILTVNLKIVTSESTKISEQTTLPIRAENAETSTIRNSEINSKSNDVSSHSQSETNTSPPQLSQLSTKSADPKFINAVTPNSIVQPWTVLEYQPITSFYHPHPVTLAQLIPPGTPWPDSPQSTRPPKRPTPYTTFPPNLVDRFPELTTLNKKPTVVTTKKPNKTPPTTSDDYVKPQTVLEYVPTTPFYYPNPVTVAQIIPPGKPWPASPEANKPESSPPQTTTVKLNERFPDLVTTTVKPQKVTVPNTKPPFTEDKTVVTTKKPNKPPPTVPNDYVKPQTVLEYVPSTSFYYPTPVTLSQIIPPGKPWPASPEKNQTGASLPQTTTIVNLNERLPDLETTTVKPTNVQVPNTNHPFVEDTKTEPPQAQTTTIKNPFNEKPTSPSPSTHLLLTYKPQRPWYVDRPGNNLNQIIPPGKPWPASAEEYSAFSVTTHAARLKESNGNGGESNLLSHSKDDDLQEVKGDLSLEPNALQYSGSRITAPPRIAIPVTPFTSGTQRTTISDIVDIYKEVHNISLVSGNSAPNPSHLLPYDDKRSPLNSSGQNRRNANGPQQFGQRGMTNGVRVYDGTLPLNDPRGRDRVFVNPKPVGN